MLSKGGFIRFNKGQIDFEFLISDIASSLVRPGPGDIDAVINENLQKIVDFLKIDRASLFQKDKQGENLVLSHVSVRKELESKEQLLFDSDFFPWLTAQNLKGKETKFSRIDDLPIEAETDKESLRRLGPKYSAITVPLLNGSDVFGIFTLGIAEEVEWPEDLFSRVRVVSHVFASALIRNKTMETLQKTLKELETLKSRLERENVYLRQEMQALHSFPKIVYRSRAMAEVLAKVEQVADTNSSVLLIGETGTGKEMIASAIHDLSLRSRRTMIRVNCGAIPAALVESEMFGREKGAYTGALSRQIGRFELAHQSTIFLDEITDLPLEVQVKLLRVLQEREIERLGNPKPIHIDVRVIAATNQSLDQAVQQGKFREDLYYRLNVFPIQIPPLRERREDIPMLVWSFIDIFSAEFGKKVESVEQSTMDALQEYSWPGNVRELRNTIERAMIVLTSTTLQIDLSKIAVRAPRSTTSVRSTENMTMREIETRHILDVLNQVTWRIRGKKGAAEILGMKPTTLETRMAKLGITRRSQ